MSTGIGDALRESREAQGRSLEEVAQSIRARSGQLQALEEEQFASFGGDVYAKGFLRSYAVELGLDPQPLLDTFRREVGEQGIGPSSHMVVPVKTPGGPRATTPPAWMAWAFVAVVVVAGIVFLGVIGPSTPDTAGEEPPVGTPPATAPPSASEEGAGPGEQGEEQEPPGSQQPDPDPVPDPDPEPAFEGVEVVLALEDASWMRVTVDGAVILEEVVEAGETRRYEADAEVIVRLGNAGGVRAQYNGEDIGAPGSSGEVVELRFTPDGYEPV